MGRIDSKGLHKTEEKIRAMVVEAPQPTNLTELRSVLGMVNNYHPFLPNLAPLHSLPHTLESLPEVKELVTSETVLTHFDPERPMILACDASAYSLGAVLSQIAQEGTEKPVAFASRTQTKAERRGYAQIDKEAFAH